MWKGKRRIQGEIRHEKETKRVIQYGNGTLVKEHVKENMQQCLSWDEQVEVWERLHNVEMKNLVEKARLDLFVTRDVHWYASKLKNRSLSLLSKYTGPPPLALHLQDASLSIECLTYHGPLLALLDDLWRNQIWSCMSSFTEAQLKGQVPKQQDLVLVHDSWAKRVNLGQVAGLLTNLVLDYLQTFANCHRVEAVPKALDVRDHLETCLGRDAKGRHLTRVVMDYAAISLAKKVRCIDHFEFMTALQRLKRHDAQVAASNDVLAAAHKTCELLLSERMQPMVEEAVLLGTVDPERQHVEAHLLDIVDCSIPITRDNNVRIHIQIGARKLRYITMSHWAILGLGQWRPAAQQAFETHTATPLKLLSLKQSVAQAYFAMLVNVPCSGDRIQFLTPSAKAYFESLQTGKMDKKDKKDKKAQIGCAASVEALTSGDS